MSQSRAEIDLTLYNNIFRLLPGVCQIRVDFLDFETKNKTDGVCDENNRLQIFSPFQRAYIPVKNFCGKILKEEVFYSCKLGYLLKKKII